MVSAVIVQPPRMALTPRARTALADLERQGRTGRPQRALMALEDTGPQVPMALLGPRPMALAEPAPFIQTDRLRAVRQTVLVALGATSVGLRPTFSWCRG